MPRALACDAPGGGSSAAGLGWWPRLGGPRLRVQRQEGAQDEIDVLISHGLCNFLDHLLLLPELSTQFWIANYIPLLCPVFHDPSCGFNYSE